jgi:Holliday junction resolvasome RuvABC endonuclease subunit
MGVAVLEGEDLIFATVKIVKDRKMKEAQALEKARQIVLKLITDYHPDILAIEKTLSAGANNSPLLNVMTAEIKKLGGRKKLRVFTILPASARKFICQNGKATKMKAASLIATRYYPWLLRYYEKDLKKKWWEEKYWVNMFDAIGLGLMCLASYGGRSGEVKAA